MFGLEKAADWWDRQKQESEIIMQAWVNDSSSDTELKAKAVIASLNQTAMEVGGSLVDVLRFGEGMKSGGLKGYGQDALRLLSLAGPLACPAVVKGAKEMVARTVNGNWRAFGNTWTLLKKGHNGQIDYNLGKIFYNPGGAVATRTYTEKAARSSINKQYWGKEGADKKHLHHWLIQYQTKWVPRGLRNAGLNLLEIPGPLNTWMGGRTGREAAFRGIVLTILGGTAASSYVITNLIIKSF